MTETGTVRRSRQRKRWPTEAEWARQAAMDAASEARRLIESSMARTALARDRLARNPLDSLALTELADAAREQAEALAQIADIQRLLTEARLGGDT